MKNARKLIPALAMLLVSAVLMSTASYAWFSMNSTVKAEGMQITAVAPDSIWISQKQDAEWTSAIKLENENTTAPGTFVPTKYDNGNFTELTNAAAPYVTPEGELKLPEDFSEEAYTSSKSYYKDVVYIKLDGRNGDGSATATAKVSVKATINSEAEDPKDEIYKAIKVAVIVDGKTVTFEFSELEKESTLQELVTLTAGAASTAVTVYAWIDGEDKDCKNANAFNEEKFTIDLVFTIEKPNA